MGAYVCGGLLLLDYTAVPLECLGQGTLTEGEGSVQLTSY
jgi:hypothetical protein